MVDCALCLRGCISRHHSLLSLESVSFELLPTIPESAYDTPKVRGADNPRYSLNFSPGARFTVTATFIAQSTCGSLRRAPRSCFYRNDQTTKIRGRGYGTSRARGTFPQGMHRSTLPGENWRRSSVLHCRRRRSSSCSCTCSNREWRRLWDSSFMIGILCRSLKTTAFCCYAEQTKA